MGWGGWGGCDACCGEEGSEGRIDEQVTLLKTLPARQKHPHVLCHPQGGGV